MSIGRTAFLLLITSVISCNDTNHKNFDASANLYGDEYKPVVISPKFSSKSVLLNSVSSITNMLFLDSSEIVGEISKMVLNQDKLYIMDKKSKTFFCFDMNGKLKWKYHKLGHKPSEYKELSDFAIRDNSIYLYSKSSEKIIQLDSAGGYKKYFPLDPDAMRFFPDFLFVEPKGRFAFCNHDMGDYKTFPYIMTIHDSSSMKITSVHIAKTANPPIKRWKAESFPLKPFSNGQGFYYCSVFNDTIYTFENNRFNRKFAIDFGESSPPSALRDDPNLKLGQFFKTKYSGNIQALFDTDSLLTFTYLKGGKPNFVFLRKSDNQIREYNFMMMDLGPIWLQVQFIGNGDNKLAFLIEPANILAANKVYRENQKDANEYNRLLNKRFPIFNKMLNSISINSNAILIFLELNNKKLFNEKK